jgi:hypothetical protein
MVNRDIRKQYQYGIAYINGQGESVRKALTIYQLSIVATLWLILLFVLANTYSVINFMRGLGL